MFYRNELACLRLFTGQITIKAALKKQHYDSKIRNRKLNTDGGVWMEML
jgi:hypothetical protein